ncbi:MAG: hypothetical protein C4523_16490 [Myxococcales bacterium]|nr:MAG: hypothetical protein C4523_16490 [Myxococcales bacterium]
MTKQKPARPFAWGEALTRWVKEFKCPECKAYALFIEKGVGGALWVRCRKCGFTMELEPFARQYMGFKETADGVTIVIPGQLGLADRAIPLSLA